MSNNQYGFCDGVSAKYFKKPSAMNLTHTLFLTLLADSVTLPEDSIQKMIGKAALVIFSRHV